MNVRDLIESNLRALEGRDTAGVLALFADDAVVDDPHHPIRPARGRDAIEATLDWTFEQLSSMSFTVDNYFERADGRGAAVEVASRIRRGKGNPTELRQLFVVESNGTKITRWTAYHTSRPNGVMGAGMRVGHAVFRLRRGSVTRR